MKKLQVFLVSLGNPASKLDLHTGFRELFQNLGGLLDVEIPEDTRIPKAQVSPGWGA